MSIFVGAVVGEPDADRRVGRAVGFGQLVAAFGLLHGKHGGAEVGAGVECLPAIVVEAEHVFCEIERSIDVETVDGSAVVE